MAITDLVWDDNLGYGFYPADAASTYGQEYWDNYVELSRGSMSAALLHFRTHWVYSHIGDASLVDIGIGCGAFMSHRPGTCGYDVNPVAIKWLKRNRRWHDPYNQPCDNASFWDSFEHIPSIAQLVANVKRFCFLSLPIFESASHARRSKHFKPHEHFWYFTRRGLCDWFTRQGFRCLGTSCAETLLGREDIATFAFQRHA